MTDSKDVSARQAAVNNPGSWEIARQYAGLIGRIPSSFSSCIRSLKTNHDDNIKNKKAGLSPGARFVASRILKGPSMLAPFFFFSATLYPEEIEEQKTLSIESLMRLHSPDVLAAVISGIYLVKRVKKLVDPELWETVQKPLIEETEMAGFVGQALTAVGIADGLLIPIGKYCGRMILSKADAKAAKEYRRYLKQKKLPFDVQEETALFGCNHFQIASVIYQTMGFGVNFATSFTEGLSAPTLASLETNRDGMRIRILEVWVDALLTTGKEPQMAHKGEYYPTKATLDLAVGAAEELKASGSANKWIARVKEDLTAEIAPGLVGPAEKAPDEAPPPDAAGVSEEEIKEITEE